MSTREDLEVLQVRATLQVTYSNKSRRLTASLVRYTQILRSLPPLLSPDLPSPPPSRPGSPVKVDPAPLKRKHEEDGHRNGEEPSQRPTIGLGFEEGLDEVAAKCVPNELHTTCRILIPCALGARDRLLRLLQLRQAVHHPLLQPLFLQT